MSVSDPDCDVPTHKLPRANAEMMLTALCGGGPETHLTDDELERRLRDIVAVLARAKLRAVPQERNG
jgi:hypothetical protein